MNFFKKGHKKENRRTEKIYTRKTLQIVCKGILISEKINFKRKPVSVIVTDTDKNVNSPRKYNSSKVPF